MLRRALLLLTPCLLLCGCPSEGPVCLDAGVDGGCTLWGNGGTGGGSGGGSGSIDPGTDHDWDLVLEDFSATADVTNLAYTDPYCSVTGGPAHGSFLPEAGQVGAVVGNISWRPAASVKGHFNVSPRMTSSGSLGAQSGTGVAGAAVHCDAYSNDNNTGSYTMKTDLSALTGNVTVSANLPINPIIGGNIGCPPNGGACMLKYYFDNTVSPHPSDPFDIGNAVSGASFTITFTGSGHSMTTTGSVHTGDYAWSGSMKLHAVLKK